MRDVISIMTPSHTYLISSVYGVADPQVVCGVLDGTMRTIGFPITRVDV